MGVFFRWFWVWLCGKTQQILDLLGAVVVEGLLLGVVFLVFEGTLFELALRANHKGRAMVFVFSFEGTLLGLVLRRNHKEATGLLGSPRHLRK